MEYAKSFNIYFCNRYNDICFLVLFIVIRLNNLQDDIKYLQKPPEHSFISL